MPKHYLPDTTPKIAAAGATVLVLLVVLSFVLSSGWMHGSSTGIILPGSEGDSPTVGTGSALLTGQSVDDITIDVNNAKTVIATLARPAAYSSRIEILLLCSGIMLIFSEQAVPFINEDNKGAICLSIDISHHLNKIIFIKECCVREGTC